MKVAIIGAGMSGLFLGYHLDRAGIAYTIYEKRPAAGGTWHDNTYPGLHVDVITRSYEFPFARKTWWSRRYAPGTEIRRYLVGFADEAGITPRIRFDTEVTSATYRDGRWDVTDAGGTTETYDVVVAATGFLRVPRLPRLPGMDSFAGTAFHSSAWDHSVPLAGKRIGVVGTGSSGIQIVSEMGNRGHQVRHFVRTPQWIIVKPNPRISMVERLLLRVPALVRYWDWRMSRLRLKTDGTETWRLVPGTDRETMTEQFHRVLREQIPDERLRAKLTPPSRPAASGSPSHPTTTRSSSGTTSNASSAASSGWSPRASSTSPARCTRST
ncbi:hypothetical protein Psuf_071570 [Phytohabitans suffuscus]|uniref:Monooxygenase n=1 Tax=Phytohabitans suffuscus TaxID=624315 RepID=A0A6F8YUT4_9ACTN|nr:NAD(P)/FAD-dependent oxidoreductase [Phytohabitans suffuscus]BCB89844.1 hypothetical protein Psuf_071570 [Phytohabitans suffuscus]